MQNFRDLDTLNPFTAEGKYGTSNEEAYTNNHEAPKETVAKN